ncbi:MAG: hypothetical protein JEZ08_04165 [Clostridiales bacterium]|nr:hypothetical protein [Clostridiales bacterium]
MFGLACYRIIDNQLTVSDPFQFFYYLQNHTVQEVYDNLTKNIITSHRNLLCGLVFEYASKDYKDYTGLIENKPERDIENYLTELSNCLQYMNKGGYINCHYNTKSDSDNRISELNIFTLELLDKGNKINTKRKAIKSVNYDFVLKEIILACQIYVEKTDIMCKTQEELIEDFQSIVDECCDVPILTFDKGSKRDFQINRYEGCIEVGNVDALKTYVSEKNSLELETITKDMIFDSILSISELKIVMNALTSNTLESALDYMDENAMLDYIRYLTNNEFIKLDMTYNAPDLFSTPNNFVINKFEMTTKGKSYLKSDKLNYLKGSRYMIREMSYALKELEEQKDKDKYLKENVYLKNFIRLY